MSKKDIWVYMKEKGLTSDDVSANVEDISSAMEYGWSLALKYISERDKKRRNGK